MSLIPYSLTRPFLFGMDAEAAHELTMDMLARGQRTPLQWAWCNETVDDPVELAGLTFPNRVGMAAGLDKNARCIDALGAMGFGFVEVGTVTPKAQPGNPKPRMFRLPEARALINRLGFNNEGLDAFLRNVQQARFRTQTRRHPMLLGLNIGKNATTPIENATSDYLTCLEGVYPHADYVTVNISSPNTQNLRALQSDAALDGLLGAIAERRGTERDLDEPGRVARRRLDALCDDREAVRLRRGRARDRGERPISGLRDAASGARGIELGSCDEVGVLREERVALRERLRVRDHDAELVERDAGQREQAMLDRADDLARDVQATVGEQVVGLVDAAGRRVLDR